MVSAFSPPARAESLLVDLLAAAGISLNSHAALSNELSDANGSALPLVLILPVRGDNDLLGTHFESLKELARHPAMPGRSIIVVLHGDRHVWDEADCLSPVHAKLKSMFFYSGVFHLCPEKLDADSATMVAQYVTGVIETAAEYTNPEESRIAAVARLLGKRPRWHAQKRNLGFYDETTGQSLLAASAPTVGRSVLATVQECRLNGLELDHALLRPDQLSAYRFDARNIDLVGNRLDFATVWPSFPGVEWINLAANDLSVVDAGLCPPTIRHLYLHKNAICTLNLPAGLPCHLKALSLYRNCLAEFDFPEDQTELVKLNLGANPITSLPETLKSASNLQFLGLARTGLRSLPDWLFEMRQLKELDISHMKHLIPRQQLQALASRGVNIICEPGGQHGVVI